jgi:cytohesin
LEVVKLLLEAGAKLSATDTLKRTALDAACRRERTDIVRFLLDHGADPTTRDKDGNTAVMYAISGMIDAPQSLGPDYDEVVRLLAQHGAKLSAANSNGQTPAQFAAQLGYNSPGLTSPN